MINKHEKQKNIYFLYPFFGFFNTIVWGEGRFTDWIFDGR
jgi:hypothetical protein